MKLSLLKGKICHFGLICLFYIIPGTLKAEATKRDSMYLKGMHDAKISYRDMGPFAGSFFPSFLAPPAGIVTTIIETTIKPKDFRLGIQDKALYLNESYYKGYLKGAHRIKNKRAFLGCATGLLFFATAYQMFYH